MEKCIQLCLTCKYALYDSEQVLLKNWPHNWVCWPWIPTCRYLFHYHRQKNEEIMPNLPFSGNGRPSKYALYDSGQVLLINWSHNWVCWPWKPICRHLFHHHRYKNEEVMPNWEFSGNGRPSKYALHDSGLVLLTNWPHYWVCWPWKPIYRYLFHCHRPKNEEVMPKYAFSGNGRP